ncbi:hypothetical protein [Streptomyces atacamensis]|uniref:hypothetical protein n=1 Tax=Streptomyces atacamensis TaxID=531966 RepID=UPI00399CE29E
MTHPTKPNGVWVPWLLAMVLFSLVVAMSAGILRSLGGADLPDAVLAGGTAFGAAMGLCLGAVTVVKELRKTT